MTNIQLDYTIYQLLSPTGVIRVGAIPIVSGSRLTSTSGLEWVDVPISLLTLNSGSFYEITFSFLGAANRNFFYNNQNVQWS